MTSLNSAIRFHGHLGPWLVLGLLMGKYGLRKINAKKYFGLSLCVSGLHKKPKSCLIDGLQLSTGCTLGKGNIRILKSKGIFVNFKNSETNKKITLRLKDKILKQLKNTTGHSASERLAKILHKKTPLDIFTLSNKR